MVVSIRMLGLYYDVGMQSQAAYQREISKRGKPGWGIYKFVSDYQNHNDLNGVSLVIGKIRYVSSIEPVF